MLIPLLTTMFGALIPPNELRTNPFGLPEQWLWSNYIIMITQSRIWTILGNSFSVGIWTVALTLAIAAPAAFAFAHLKFFGEQMLFNYLILGLTLPFATAILPLSLPILSTVAITPAVLAFLAAQKYIVAGLTAGPVKG